MWAVFTLDCVGYVYCFFCNRLDVAIVGTGVLDGPCVFSKIVFWATKKAWKFPSRFFVLILLIRM